MKNEENLREYLQGQEFRNIRLYSVNENYFVKEECASYFIDGAIEFELHEGKYFTIGFSDTFKMFDYQPVQSEVLFESLAYEDLNIHDFDLSTYLHQQINSVEFKWGWYQEYNEDFELKEEKEYLPIAMILKFANDSTLFLASANFQIMGHELVNLSYDLEAMLLIANHTDFEIDNIFSED